MKNLYELSIMSSSTLQDAPEHIKAKKFNIVIKSDTIITSVCLVNCCDHQNVLSQNQLSPSIFLDQKLLFITVDRFQPPKTPTLFTAHALFLQREYKVIISDASKFFFNQLVRAVCDDSVLLFKGHILPSHTVFKIKFGRFTMANCVSLFRGTAFAQKLLFFLLKNRLLSPCTKSASRFAQMSQKWYKKSPFFRVFFPQNC